MKVRKASGRKLDLGKKSEIINDAYLAPGELNEPSDNLLDYVILLYGESGIGKTSTASKIPGSYVIQCDPNRRGLKIRQTCIDDMTISELKENRDKPTPWEVIKSVYKKACADKSVKVIVIDNFGMFYEHCLRHRCFKLGIDDPQEQNDYGQTWRDIKDEMVSLLNKVNSVGKGLFLIAHDAKKEILLKDDTTVERIQPALMSAPFDFVKAVTNFAFYMAHLSSGRVVYLRTGSEIWSKCCTDGDQPRFFDPEGNPVNRIPAGNSPSECWQNILRSWDNELFDVDHVDESKKRKKKKIRA